MKKRRVGIADLIQRGGIYRTGNLVQTGKPLLLKTTDEGLVIPGQVGYHDDIATGDVAAHVAITLQQDDVLGARPGGSHSCRVAGGAAAHYQDIAFGLNRQFTGRLHIYVAH